MDQEQDYQTVAIYVRVSTDKQEAENQTLQLTKFCEQKGWTIYKVYQDIISGKEEKRPAFDALFQDAHKLHFDILLFWDMSRFSRSGTLFTLQKFRELENIGVGWHSYQEPYISTTGPWKDVVISIFATIARMEREKISERTKAGLERARLNGKRFGRRARKYDFERIWKEYQIQGTINRTARILHTVYGYGSVHLIITKNIHTQEEYDRAIKEETLHWNENKKKKAQSLNEGKTKETEDEK